MAASAWREGGQALLAVYREMVTASGEHEGGEWPAVAAGRARLRRRVRRAVDAWRESARRRIAWGRVRNIPAFARAGAPEHVL